MDSTSPQPVPSETSASPESVTMPPAPWKRPVLVFTGLSLLAAGAGLNAERLGLSLDAPPEAATLEEAAPSWQAEEDAQGHRHKGEEGRMGRPSRQRNTGLYAMKGPQHAAPEMARSFDPNLQSGNAGVLGLITQESGHFLAAPSGGSFAVGNDDADLWGGLHNQRIGTPVDPKSTFSIDVDTAAYANVRRLLFDDGSMPPPDAVRTEEMINYFDYDYAQPSGGAPFSITTEVGPAPWDASHRVVHIGIQGKSVATTDLPPRNLVFLIDVSGSMSGPDKLGLLQKGLRALAAQMNSRDRISLVVYAGAAGVVLPPTSGAEHSTINDALDRLSAGGSTNGSEGIHLAYELAQESFIPGGVNRVLIATDGDFNVGTTGHRALMELIEAKRETGVFLSVLGVGGASFNDHMMEQLADKGNGNYAYLDSELEAHKVLVEESGAMLQTIAKDVKIQVQFDPDQVRSHRLIGYENRVLAHSDFDDDTKDAGEIGAGHTVTALYDIVPMEGAGEEALMTLNLRYKEPDGERSKRMSVPVGDDGRGLAESSDDFRFSAAVAMLGQKLRGDSSQAKTTYNEIMQLARDSTGSDPYCYRHQFIQLAAKAGTLSGESIHISVPACHATPPQPQPSSERTDTDGAAPTNITTVLEPKDAREPFDWGALVLKVLRLLPPLLALPFFVMAFWRPRRRRGGSL